MGRMPYWASIAKDQPVQLHSLVHGATLSAFKSPNVLWSHYRTRYLLTRLCDCPGWSGAMLAVYGMTLMLE
ncbi:hypothetical protein DPMN_036646 [Dreissena polymorpha]|uniref:Uncharacterized protein n=1 Tax=Dreissena polymorpha TaxID=45954 RepID=A0A9D4MBW4_DREPO|nr:hypothetical protein DPMN_036646 [Dreissena polymorpha]